MSATTTDAVYAAVRDADPSVLARDGCTELLGDVRRLRSWLDSVEMATTRRVRELNAAGEAEPPESLIPPASGCSGKDTKNLQDRTDLCDDAPSLEDALATGEVTSSHLDAIAAAARDLPDEVRAEFLTHADALLAKASTTSIEGFRRECRQLAKKLLAMSRAGSDADELEAQKRASKLTRWTDEVDGMHHTHLTLDPERDAKLRKAWNAELARLRKAYGSDVSWQQLQVDAFINAVAGIATPTKDDEAGTGRSHVDDDDPETGNVQAPLGSCSCGGGMRRVDRVPDASVVVSYECLTGQVPDGICETSDGQPLPISTVRRLCCDAEIIPTIIGTHGEVLDQGRSSRTATRPQRSALRAMHRGCTFPGCTIGFDACRIHHVTWWWVHKGPTDLDNLLPLCEKHHHLVHEGGWTLTLDSDPQRTATWTRPDGTHHDRGTTIDRRPDSS